MDNVNTLLVLHNVISALSAAWYCDYLSYGPCRKQYSVYNLTKYVSTSLFILSSIVRSNVFEIHLNYRDW